MRGRPDVSNDNRVPGPGDYDPNLTIVKEKSPSKSFARTERK